MKKILLINPFGLGDVLFTTPVIAALKNALPGIKIGYLCNQRVAPILESNPYIDSLFIYERDEFEAIRRKSFFAWLRKIIVFLNQIRNEHFDAAIDFSLNTQYGFFSWYAGIKQRFGYDYRKRGAFLTHKIRLSGYCGKHIVEYYAGLLKYLGIDSKGGKLELYLKAEDKISAEKLLAKEGVAEADLLVGVIPGGGRSWGKDSYLKHWPAQYFVELADKIVENYKAKIIIMGDFSEEALAKKISEGMHYKAINLAGLTTIGELSALLDRMNLVIANDGGPLHLAVALGKKTVSFFGPVDPLVYGPYPPDEKQHVVLRKALSCSPCYNQFRLNQCTRDKECLNKIGLDEALKAVNKLFS